MTELAPGRTQTTAAQRLGPAAQYALLAGPLLSMVDSSIVNVAVEPISKELNASLIVTQWAVSGCLLALCRHRVPGPQIRHIAGLPGQRHRVHDRVRVLRDRP